MQTQACDRCHRRKTRCDRRLPRCSACERASMPCLHTDKVNLLSYPRAYINSLETSLRRLHSEKQRLANQLKTLRESLATKAPQTARPEAEDPFIEDSQPNGKDGEDGNGNKNKVPQKEQNENVISSEVGLLTLKATGEQRYLGSSSGVTLAGIVYSLVESAKLPSRAKDRASLGEDILSTENIAPIFPVRTTAMPAIEAYFNHWHLTFPLVCRPQFLDIVDRIYADEQYFGKNAFDAFLFHMVLGMGSVNFNNPDWSTMSSESHYVHAISKLEEVLSMKGLAPLQAILLVCQYSIFCSLRDTSANMWHLIGIAARLCVEMGLHRKSRADDFAAQGAEGGQVRLDIEVRKRAFWCFYNLDRIISVTLGRPVALRDEDIDIPLPTAFDIDELPLEELLKGVNISRLQYKSPFLHLIGVRRLAGKVLQTIHCASKPDKGSAEKSVSIRNDLQDELEAWKADIPNVKLPMPEHNSMSVSPFTSKIWYEIPYHNALLLLYRPSPMFPPVPSSSSSRKSTSVTGLNDTLLSAVSAIHLYAELHRTRRLNYSWITLHAVFIAGLSYVYSISRIIKESTPHSDTLPICLEYTRVIDVTRACSNVLVAINERWGAARESCEIFDQLSTAIIQDSVKAQLEINNRRTTSKNVGQSPSPNVPHRKPGQETQVQEESHLARKNEETSTSGTFYDATFPLVLSESCPVPTAETGLRQFSQNLHNQISHEFSDLGAIPSEVAVGFSQDWFADDIGMADFQSPGHVYNDMFMEPFG